MKIAAGLEYETHGSGEPVLFIHGGAVCDADLPLMSQPALADYMLIRYRRRGYGGSARHDGPCTFKEQAADALALLQALGVQRAHVVSHSYAGLIALQLTLDFPEAVHSLVLSEPALGMLLPGEQGPQGQLFAGARTLAEAGDHAGAVNTILQFALGPTWRSDVAKMLPGAPEQVDRDAASTFPFESPLAGWDFSELAAKQIVQPVLSVKGSESMPRAEEIRHLLHSRLPQTEDYDVLGANHQMQYSPLSAARYAEVIAAFLKRHRIAWK
jgi:pimeloyl-ACP methyl ester carboxylesterase